MNALKRTIKTITNSKWQGMVVRMKARFGKMDN